MDEKKKTPLLFRQSIIKSWKMWKEGFKNLTPLDHAFAKRSGHFWGTLGGTTASLALIFQVPFGTSILSAGATLGFGMLVGGISWLQFVEWRKEDQKIYELKRMQEMIEQ